MARLPILTFHTLADDAAVISYPPAVLADLAALLHDRGYQTLRLDQAVALLRGGGDLPPGPLPGREGESHSPSLVRGVAGGGVKYVVLTFDDGYQSVYDLAFPILQRYGMTATVFVTTGRGTASSQGRLPALGGRPLLAWSELREMQTAGIEIGGHTLTHPDLTRLAPAQVEEEVAGSKARLEDGLSAAVTSFAYPFGRYNPFVRQVAQRFFETACSVRLGLASESSDLFALERVEMYYFRATRRLKLLTSPWLRAYLGVRGIPRTLRR